MQHCQSLIVNPMGNKVAFQLGDQCCTGYVRELVYLKTARVGINEYKVLFLLQFKDIHCSEGPWQVRDVV